MGRIYLFECTKCGYRATVAGGADRGLHLAVQTIHCLDCRDLRDVVTELKRPGQAAIFPRWKIKPTIFEPGLETEPPPTFAAAMNFLAVGSGKPFRWVKFKPVCPVSPRHRIRLWQQPGKCPKCGNFLDGSATPFKIWD